MYLPGVDSLGALIAAQLVFVGLGMAGAYGIMRRLGAGPWVALGTATAWGLSPTIVGLQGFGGTFVGYALLPAYAWLDLVVMDAVAARRRLVPLLAGYVFVRTGALFMDGYSFIASGLVGTALWVAWLVPRGRPRLLGLAVLIGSNLVAAVLYRLYVPVDYEVSAPGVFRSMSLDLVTLLLPSNDIWFASKLGLQADHGRLWGDTTNSLFNYLGFVGLALAAWYLVRHWRSGVPVALAVAGVLALVLALGPEVKFDLARPPGGDPYNMPADRARAAVGRRARRRSRARVDPCDLPLVRGQPDGADPARRPGDRGAGARAGAAEAGARGRAGRRRRGRGAADGAAVRARLPRPLRRPRRRARRGVSDLDRATRDGERAFFLGYDGRHNDFLANYLAAATELRAYNAGGDKNSAYAAWGAAARGAAARGAQPAAGGGRAGAAVGGRWTSSCCPRSTCWRTRRRGRRRPSSAPPPSRRSGPCCPRPGSTCGATAGSRPCGSADLAELAGLDLVDEAADGVLLRDERARLDAGDRLAHVLVEVGERLGRPLRLVPVSSWIDCLNSSSVNVSMPQSVWWMRMISSVPSRRWEIASERISSSVTTPPALRITCASPSSRPSAP